MTLTFRRDDSVGAVLPPDRGYWVLDANGNVRGVVAGSGRAWWAGPVSPSRTKRLPWTVCAETRIAAAERLVRGRP